MLFRSWRFVLTVVAVALLGIAVAPPAAAQEDEENAFDFAQIEGVELVVSRTYSIDFTAMMENVTPDATFDPTSLMGEGPVTLVALVGKFDDDGHAEDGLNKLDEEFTAQSDELTEGAEIEEVDLGDLGDNRKGYQTTVEDEGMSLNIAVLIVQQDEYVYIGLGSTLGDDAVEPTKAIIEAMIDADEGDDEVETDENGVNSGGLWDKLPKAGDEAIGALVPAGDEQVYPEVESTPEA